MQAVSQTALTYKVEVLLKFDAIIKRRDSSKYFLSRQRKLSKDGDVIRYIIYEQCD